MIFNKEPHKYADIFPMIDDNELEILKDDIKENGLLEPIILFEDKILDGRNRYKACKELNIEPKFEIYDGDKPLEYVISLNLKRRHLTQSQRGVIALEVLPLLEQEAEKRRRELISKSRSSETVVNLPPSQKKENKSSFQAGKLFGVGEKYVREAKRLKERSPELLEEVKKGNKNFSEIKNEERIENIKRQREEIRKEVMQKPTGLYDVIVIDPPWRYDGDIFKELDECLPPYDCDGYRGTAPYPTMSLEEIKNIKLPIKDDCVLWLWTTNLFLLEMKPLLEHWGFTIKSVLTWDKDMIGTGRWLRSQTEHCILAIKGKPFFNNTKWSTLIREKRTEHSVKPNIFYKMVDEICEGRKLDYFARKKRDGWDVYGNDIKE